MGLSISAFYSDPHFGHANIIELCGRPFPDVVVMNAVLIANYNAMISPNDVVLWLGDCFFHIEKAARREILHRMNGTKILIRGNHDRDSDSYMASIGFALVVPSAVLVIDGVRCRGSHYPYGSREMAQANPRIPCKSGPEVLIHGHTHGKQPMHPGRYDQIDVGVDAWNYRPAMMTEVVSILRATRS